MMQGAWKLASGIFLLFAFCPALAWLEEEPCYIIEHIEIQSYDVFEDLENPRKIHRLAQALHRSTRQKAIREECLFREGDCLDEDLVAETERNLRALKIFSDAYIQKTYDKEQRRVRLKVVTVDRFTLRLSFSASRKGGINKFRISAGDTNLLGLNKDLHFTHETRSDGGDINRFVYKDARLFSHFRLNTIHSQTDEGLYWEAQVEKPFWELQDEYAYSLTATQDHTRADFYEDGAVNTEVDQEINSYIFQWSKELGSVDFSRRVAVETGFRSKQYGFAPDKIVAPPPTDSVPFTLSLFFDDRKDFVVRRGVDSLVKREDIALHLGFSLGGGFEYRRRLGADFLNPMVHGGFDFVGAPGANQLNAAGIQGRLRTNNGNTGAANLSGFYHHYLFASKNQTWVGGVAFELISIKDDFYQPLTLGEDRGLRGYDAFTFTGNKSLLLNLEHRLQYPWGSERWAVGQVLFVDSGSVWKPGSSPDLGQLHWSAGWGLRIDAPSLFGKQVVRLDIAIPFDGGNPTYSFAVGQVFRHNGVNEGFSRDF